MAKAHTLVSIFDDSAKEFSDRTAIKSEITGEQWIYEQSRENSLRVSNTLWQKGVGKGDRVVIISDNNPNFVFGDYGVLYAGAASVPIDQSLRSENLLQDYLQFAQPKAILVEEKYKDKVKKHNSQTQLITLEEALQSEPKRPDVEISQDDISTIIFSSGTTSESERAFKAIMLSRENIASNVLAAEFLTSRVEKIDRKGQGVYMAGIARHWHSFEYMVQKAFLHAGALLHFTNVQRVQKRNSGAEINPHYMIMIPRFANILMNEIKEQIKSKGKKTYRLFERFLENSNQYNFNRINNGRFIFKKWVLHQVADGLFYKKIREGLEKKLGKNLLYIVGGSAPLPIETQLFFYSIGIPIYQGYGLTETSPVTSVNTPEESRFGSSGKLIKGVEVLIADIEEAERKKIRVLEDSKEGVILVKGRNVFKGYLRDEKKTMGSFVEGWFNTEDTGYMQKGYLYVTGREKDLICLSTGEKINPAPIETYYPAKGLNMLLVGNNQNRAGALVIPDEKMSSKIKRGDLEEFTAYVLSLLADSNQKFGIGFSSKNIAVVHDFYEHPELTSGTMKARRKLVEKHYVSLIKQICN